ncbi:MAG: hypothetical protein M1827_007678 [Pycnora praestabilis]|nr:MAG: hypothetical protein M1827_007678 [Pycnora praestabilis]
MADEPRRSGRATKGQHTKNVDPPDITTPKRSTKGVAGKSKLSKHDSAAPTPSDDDDGNAIIRCVCGAAEENEDDDRKMIYCDQCTVWQHNECMEISENEEELPEVYLCEICRPENHQDLLTKIAKGEKPWEDRAREREREEEERKARRRKGGKKGKGGKRGRPSDLKSEASEEVNGKEPLNTEETSMTVDEAADQKQTTRTPSEPQVTPGGLEGLNKRKLPGEAEGEEVADTGREPKPKIRKVSSRYIKDTNVREEKPSPQRRASKAMPAPARRDSKDGPIQTELVQNISDLQNTFRKNIAETLLKTFKQQVTAAEKTGSLSLPKNETADAFATRFALGVEHAVFINISNVPGDPNEDYRTKVRTMMFNLKKNPALRDRLFQGLLTPDEFSTMSSDEMASKELQERTAEMRKEADKQATIIQEEGPRIRRTHKGEELVSDDTQQTGGSESVFAAAPARHKESVADAEAPRAASPTAMSPESPTAVELPEDLGYGVGAGSLPDAKPLTVDTKASPGGIGLERKSSSAFNIQDVWSSVHSPDAEKQRLLRQPAKRTRSEAGLKDSQGPGADPEIDQLLKDEDIESPPYSPTDYDSDPSTIWRGKLAMSNVAECLASGKHVGGADLSNTIPWSQLVPNALNIDGRIDIDRAGEYLCGLRWSRTTDVTVIALTPQAEPNARAGFDKLFNYFSERKRYGVISKLANSAIKDVYVVPLDAGMGKKPDFVEILEHCTIEEPRPERTILATFVIRTNNTPSAQATPRQFDNVGVAASPIAPVDTTRGPAATPVPMGHPGSQISPAPGYGGTPTGGDGTSSQAPTYNSPYNQFPMAQQPYQQAPQIPLTGAAAAAHVLGPLADAPVVRELLTQVPHMGAPEFGVVKDILEREPTARDNLQMLTGILQQQSNAR